KPTPAKSSRDRRRPHCILAGTRRHFAQARTRERRCVDGRPGGRGRRRSPWPSVGTGAAIRAGARALGEAHLQPPSGLVLGGRGDFGGLGRHARAGAADRGRAPPDESVDERALSTTGTYASTTGAAGSHVGDEVEVDAAFETAQEPADGR